MERIWNKHKQSNNTPLKRKVFVAMSGGVDSSVAAALLKKRGFEVVGVFMRPWSPDRPTTYNLQPTTKNQESKKSSVVGRGSLVSCIWKQDREDAMRAASALSIPLKTWDFSKEYKKSVTDYMVREYKAGRTPNPDVMCNKEIKFGLFFEKAIKEGADYIATGHYVRLVKRLSPRLPFDRPASDLTAFVGRSSLRETMPASLLKARFVADRFANKLLTAKDKNKDQSYFLWTLNQKILSKCLFPIGDYLKPEVRKLAKKFGLPNHDKKDSQGVCFIGPLDMKDFLKTKIKPKPGKIIFNSQEIGRHDGAYYYTIGQRHGLNIGIDGGPYYVVTKDLKKNIIYVGIEKDLLSQKAKVSQINWINPHTHTSDGINPRSGHLMSVGINEPLKFPVEISVRTRYRAPLKKAALNKNGELKFKTPERAITPGQSAVFYKNGELLGGGIIM